MKIYKMKWLILISLAFIVSNQIIAQNFDIIGKLFLSPMPSPYGIEILDENSLELYWYSNDEVADWDKVLKYNYRFDSEEGLPYLILDKNIPENIEQGLYVDHPFREYGNKILLLVGFIPELVTNFTSKEEYYPMVSVGYTVSKSDRGFHLFLQDIPSFEFNSRIHKDASSALVESGIRYDVTNLNSLFSDTPWVEDVEGYGIGESFVIEKFWDRYYSKLFIINGFISADRPRLYTQNGRIKRIKVEGLTSGNIGYCEVLDTPHPQTVDISFIKEAEDIRVTIEDVYPGTKYEDTAIHYMITYEKEIIPYQDNIELNQK